MTGDESDGVGAPLSASEAMTVKRVFTRDEVAQQLADLGVRAGDVVVVHTAFSRVGPIEGGPMGLVEALRTALGPDGTLVMPSMTDDDDHVFDRLTTPCVGMGVVADTFRRMPGVMRSDSPHAFAAVGPRAAAITAAHPIAVPHGLDSPPGRVYELDGKVLLLGVGHDADTTVHVAENVGGVRYRRRGYSMVLTDGGPVRFDYEETDHCCERFALVDEWLGEKQRRGMVGNGEARLARSRDIVDTVVARLRREETTFLHAPAECDECDEARASLPPPT